MNFHEKSNGKLVAWEGGTELAWPWHFTASAVVLFRDHVLLVHHKRIAAWLPPGGHFEGAELPHQAAVRETLEETGLAVAVLSDPLPEATDKEAFFVPPPLCMQVVQAVEKGGAVFHVDLAYLCHPVFERDDPADSDPAYLPDLTQTEEVHGSRWVELSALDDLQLAKNVAEIINMAVARLAII